MQNKKQFVLAAFGLSAMSAIAQTNVVVYG